MRKYLLIVFIILVLPALTVLAGSMELFWFRFLGFSYMVLGFVAMLFMDRLEGSFSLKAAAVFFVSGLLMLFTYF